jgi:hypothetical protein
MTKGTLLQPSLVGSKERLPMKKEATPKRKGLKRNTYDEKKGEKSRRSLRIMKFLLYLSPRSSVLSRGMHWVNH